ncbi:hypothetical protein AVEN_159559-1 [Araneus ventricosus]|uniref:Uncharacterized protein n=1 Tax=Araneus ventricosus TaxID=182803 RepID=A0A4Y2P988_ARAVE|nr:hypothetical protein AVEN_159559-1 [Araneus ventricosus]
MDYMKSSVLLGENWFVSKGSSLQNGKINKIGSQLEPIHDIYTIKGTDGEVRRVHYAVDEHGLRANIHSNSLGLGTNPKTISIQSEPRRWPSDDFDFGLDEFISMRQTEKTPVFPNFVQMALAKPSILSQDISEGIPHKEVKFSSANANLPASIYSKRLFTKLVPTDPQQFPHTGKTFAEKIPYGTNARNENLNKYRTPSDVSSPNYVPSSKIYPTNNFFESQRIVKPIIQPYSIPILSLDSFPKNGSRNFDTNITEIPNTEIQEDGNTSNPNVPKSALNLEAFPAFGTTTNLSENEEYVVFQNVKKEYSISEPTRDYNQTEYNDAYTKSNSSKPILFIPVSNDSIPIIEIKTQTEPNFSNSLTSKPFGLVPLSTIFDLNSDEGGPYYHYVMNMGKNSGDTVSELIEKYFELGNDNKLLNDTNDNISSNSTDNITENHKDYPGNTENNINTGLKINEHILDSNENKNSPSNSIINASLSFIESENYPRNTSQIASTKSISREVSVQNISKAVNEEIMRIVNDQRVTSPAVTEGKVTGFDNVLNVLPIQQIVIEEVINSTTTNDHSFNHALNSLEENIKKNTDNYAEMRIQPELFNNTSRGIINVETTYSPTLKFPDRNSKTHEANNSKLTDNIFISLPGFTNIAETTPDTMHLEQHSAAILKSQNDERNATLTNATETSSFYVLNSNADSSQVSSSDILDKSEANNSIESNSYPNKSAIRVMAKLNLLSPADEVIAHNGIQTLSLNLKEGRNLNIQMGHPMLELMIPKAKMNDFMMKINNTPVMLRILHPEIVASETIPYIFKFQDGDGSFSDKDTDSNYNSNLSDNLNNILNLLQPNLPKYNKDSTSTSTSKTAEIDHSVVPMANNNEITTTFPTEGLTSDSLDEKSNLNNTSVVQEEYETIARLDADSSVSYPVVQESKIVESASIDRRNSKQFVNLHLFNNSETQNIDKNKAENKSKNKFYSYVANIIHNSGFPEKDRYKSRTKIQPLDFNEFNKLIYKNQNNGVPNGYEIVQNIANKLDTEDFQSQNFEIKDFLTANDLNNAGSVPKQDIRINNIDDLSSSVQYAVIPYEGLEYSNKV